MRFRFHLGRPRAAAHGWGKVARILTEINRLPQAAPVLPTKNSRQTKAIFRPFATGAAFRPGSSASRPILLL
jgi:hypothetical protein